MRIRKYMVLGVLSIVVFPWFVYFFIHLLDTHSWQPWAAAQSSLQQAESTQAIQIITQNVSSWTNPTWQQHLQTELSNDGIVAVIRSPSNQVIFDSALGGHHHWMWSQQIMVVQSGQLLGTIQLDIPSGGDVFAAISAFVAAILAMGFVGFQIRRSVIRPLEAMSRAALQIAEGDLDLELPTSRVVEIRQVRTAFHVMVQGLREAFSKQTKLEEERRFFIGAIAHDLRTPLFSLRGYLDGLEQGIAASPDKVAKYVAVCKAKATHLERLVSDLFAFTRLEYMEQTLRRERFNFSEVVKRTVESIRPLAQERGIHLSAEAQTGVSVTSGDAHLIERALTNLLDNALRYTPVDGKVTVHLREEIDKIVITVRDTGPGFSPHDLQGVFEPLYRGDVSRNLDTGGSGLGLAIAKRIFTSHGGGLKAENATDGGALLTGWIPRVCSE